VKSNKYQNEKDACLMMMATFMQTKTIYSMVLKFCTVSSQFEISTDFRGLTPNFGGGTWFILTSIPSTIYHIGFGIWSQLNGRSSRKKLDAWCFTGLLISVSVPILYQRYFRSIGIGIAETFVREYRERYRRYFNGWFSPIFVTDTTNSWDWETWWSSPGSRQICSWWCIRAR